VKAPGIALGLLLAAAAAHAQEEQPALNVPIPGTRVSAIVPEGFALADDFPGMVHDYVETTVVVSELPLPPETVLAWLEPELLEERDTRRLKIEDLTLEDGEAVLLELREDRDDGERYRWIAVFGNAHESVVVVVSTLDSLESRLRADALALIGSLRWDPSRRPDPLRGLPFRVDAHLPLVFQPGLRDHAVLLQADQVGPLRPGDPRAFVARYTVGSEIDDLPRHAREHLSASPELATLEAVVSEQAIRMGGLDGWEIVARGVAFDGPVPLVAYQALAVDGDRVYAVQGFVAREAGEDWLPVFRQLSHSFRRAR
jgi:hypothetical protein